MNRCGASHFPDLDAQQSKVTLVSDSPGDETGGFSMPASQKFLFWDGFFWWVLYVNFMRLPDNKFMAKIAIPSSKAASLQIQIFQATICHTISTVKRAVTTIPYESWDKNSEPPIQCR